MTIIPFEEQDQIVPELYQQFSKAFLKDFNHVVQSIAYKYGEVWIETEQNEQQTIFTLKHVAAPYEVVWLIEKDRAIRRSLVEEGEVETWNVELFPFVPTPVYSFPVFSRATLDYLDTTDFSK